MDNRQFIALDLGRAHTGIARASALAQLAEPLGTFPTGDVPEKIKQLNSQEAIEALIIGLPRGLSGQETEQTEWVRQWVEHHMLRLGLPVYAQDEALTSKLAEAHKFAGKNLHDIDALAAAIILQDFLDTPENDRMVW